MENMMRITFYLTVTASFCLAVSASSGQTRRMCSQQEITIAVYPCLRKFFMTLREAEGKDCESHLKSTVPPCINSTISYCDQQQINAVMSSVIAQKNVFCGSGSLDLIVMKPSGCNATYTLKEGECRNKMSAFYQKSRYSPDLCSEYEKYVECFVDSGKQYCTGWNSYQANYSSILSRDSNPFCSENQLSGCSAIQFSFIILVTAFIVQFLLSN